MIIDLHCDSLYKAVTDKIPLDSKALDVQLVTDGKFGIQCFAIWLPDTFSPSQAEKTIFSAYRVLKAECERLSVNLVISFKNIREDIKKNSRNAIFTIENGLCINGKIENVKRFALLGVRMMTLTWNSHNEIGDGAGVETPNGLTEFGRQVIIEMEKHGMIVDVSHASDKLFYDVASVSSRPFIASHSNSRSITCNRRNLTDEQFMIIMERGGISGLNFHSEFLNNNSQKASMYDILRHAEHFLSIGGENTLALGTDFDGCTLPEDIFGSSSMSAVYEMFLKHNYSETVVKKIFYENALNFFENFDN